MKRLRGTLTYANVVSTLCLFLLLGGTVYAASKINGKTIKVNSIPGNRLKPNTVTGKQVKESTLGEVPVAKEAKTAGSAVTALDAVNAEKIIGRTIGCPTGTQLFAGECWETTARSAATMPVAAQTCSEAGGQLPDALSLRAFALKSGVTLAAGDEWSNSIDNVTAENEYTGVTVSPTGAVNLDNQIDPKEFRCELPLLR
jgi:hypothetical protein